MEPTRTMNANVFSIQPCDNKDTNKSISPYKESDTEKSFKMNTPTTIPLKRETSTFLVSRAKIIAKREGTKERAEGSMLKLYF